jgi:HD superfamily phosphohydrolase
LAQILKRAKTLVEKQEKLPTNSDLLFFLQNRITLENFSNEVLDVFAQLDEHTLMNAVNQWQHHPDFVLQNLCERLLNRKLFKVKLNNEPYSDDFYRKKIEMVQTLYELSEEDAQYFVFGGVVSNKGYDNQLDKINILTTKGKIKDISKVSKLFTSTFLTEKLTKNYLCFPKS